MTGKTIHDYIKDILPRIQEGKPNGYDLGRCAQQLEPLLLPGSKSRVYVRMPPRSGKTTLATALIVQACKEGRSALYVAPNDNLSRIMARKLSNILGADSGPKSFICCTTRSLQCPLINSKDLVVFDLQDGEDNAEGVLSWYQGLSKMLSPGASVVFIEPTGQADNAPAPVTFKDFNELEPMAWRYYSRDIAHYRREAGERIKLAARPAATGRETREASDGSTQRVCPHCGGALGVGQ